MISLAHLMDAVLSLYAWAVAAILAIALFLIARFYQRKSGNRSWYSVFLAPAVLFFAAGLLGALDLDRYPSDLLVSLMLFIAGMTLIIIGGALLRKMTGGRR